MKFPKLNEYIPYFKPVVREVYTTYDRDIIQFLPECARYDSTLSYTLKPGVCEFNNREFSTTYQINSFGFRDDERSLQSPEIILLGDSYTMGWGVDQDSSFAQLIEHATGLKTLNAGISSYGTARELLALARLDKSNLKYLIIQYNDGDYFENKSYVENNFTLNIMDEGSYESTLAEHIERKRYAPFIYLRTFVSFYKNHLLHGITGYIIMTAIAANEDKATTPEQYFREHAFYFLELLSRIQNIQTNVQLIVLRVEGRTTVQRNFESQLLQLIKEERYPEFIENTKIIYCADFLTPKDYFMLDDHIKTTGHRKIATQLNRLILEE